MEDFLVLDSCAKKSGDCTMPVKRALLLGTSLIVVWLIGVADLRFHPWPDIRFINDNYDHENEFRYGSWIVHSEIPYRDTFSEYPQIPTYLFALPYLGLSWLYPMDKLGYRAWTSVFSLLMFALLFVEIVLLHREIRIRKYLAFLLLLPAYLYFTYNRFDVLPALICLISFLFLSRNKFIWAAILLGIGTFTKWYPALLLPIYLVYYWYARKKIPWGMMFAYGGTCLLIILPTLLSGGLPSFLAPFLFQTGRAARITTLPGLVELGISALTGNPPGFLMTLLLILQVVFSAVCIFFRIDTPRKVLLWSNLVIACFILFARIYSPQWILWLAPFLILSVENQWDVIWIVAGGLVTYLAFPVIFDAAGEFDARMVLMGITQIIFLVRVIITSVRRLRPLSAAPSSGGKSESPALRMNFSE
jgi:hypothetical protein